MPGPASARRLTADDARAASVRSAWRGLRHRRVHVHLARARWGNPDDAQVAETTHRSRRHRTGAMCIRHLEQGRSTALAHLTAARRRALNHRVVLSACEPDGRKHPAGRRGCSVHRGGFRAGSDNARCCAEWLIVDPRRTPCAPGGGEAAHRTPGPFAAPRPPPIRGTTAVAPCPLTLPSSAPSAIPKNAQPGSRRENAVGRAP